MELREIDNLKETREYKACDALSDAVNTFSWDEKKFAESFTLMHRTLQQNIFRTLLEVVKIAASDEYMYDGRNESTHEVAKKIMETGVLDEVYLPTI